MMAQSYRESKRLYKEKIHLSSPTIKCGCGCETEMRQISIHGRIRRFVRGHGRRGTADKEARKARFKRYEAEDRGKRKHKLLEMFGSSCCDCNVAYTGNNAAIFHFHHRNPKTKLFGVATGTSSRMRWSKLIKEVRKCDILCANCHALRHH